MICVASAEASEPGETPDFEASLEVFSWMWMFRGGRSGKVERPMLSWVAFLGVSIEETVWRFGRVEESGLDLSVWKLMLVSVKMMCEIEMRL